MLQIVIFTNVLSFLNNQHGNVSTLQEGQLFANKGAKFGLTIVPDELRALHVTNDAESSNLHKLHIILQFKQHCEVYDTLHRVLNCVSPTNIADMVIIEVEYSSILHL